MSKFLRLAVAAVAAVAGSLVVLPGVALASFGPDMEFTMAGTVTVGDTGLPASITLTNGSDGGEDGFTAVVCNQGNNPPCLDPDTAPPDDDIGINLILSCGAFGSSTTCATFDPGVFRTSPTATGRDGTECEDEIFDIVDYNPAVGALRFTPRGIGANGPNVVLADPGVGCIIDFTVDVIGYPTVDRSAAPGQQTGQLGDVTAYSDNVQELPGEASDSRDITVSRAQPIISTIASPTVGLGGTLTDRATIGGRAFPDAAADVTFSLFGPDDATCAGPAIFTSTVSISSTDTQVTSEPFTPTAIGTYRWIASYAGDSNNEPVAGECNDANESVVVTPGQPELSTTASPTVRLGAGELTDTATVSGRVGPLASTVSFSLFGPGDATCAGPAIFTDTDVALPTTSDSVTSAGYTPTVPGTYRWIATYSGDANNLPAAGECNDAGESTVVDKAQPVLATDAGADVSIGDELTDTATVTGRVSAGDATLDFRLFGPNDNDCSDDAVFEQLGVPFAASDDSITSEGFAPTAVGTYRWVVTYSGDDNNEGAVGECGDPLETVEVTLGAPTIVTEASASVPVGVGQLSDAAVVNGRVDPQVGATVSFRLYGPGDTTCSAAPVFEDLDVAYPVGGGTVRSGTYTPTAVGTYRWVASYSGDANNLPAVGVCGDAAETVIVTAAPVTELPATGAETQMLMRSGGALFLVGIALVGVGNRKRYAN